MRTKMMLFFCLTTMAVSAGNYEVSSPNGKVKVTVNTDAAVQWSVDYDGRQVLLPSTIDIRMVQGKKTVGLGTVGKVAKLSVNSSFKNPFYKRMTVNDAYGLRWPMKPWNSVLPTTFLPLSLMSTTIGQESAIAIPSSPIMMRSLCQRCTLTHWPSPRWPSACLTV